MDLHVFDHTFFRGSHLLLRLTKTMCYLCSDIYLSLERVCLEGTRAQSKVAVSAIAALISSSEKFVFSELAKVCSRLFMHSRFLGQGLFICFWMFCDAVSLCCLAVSRLSDVFQVLVDSLKNGHNIATILQALGCLAQHSIHAYETFRMEVTAYLEDIIFQKSNVSLSITIFNVIVRKIILQDLLTSGKNKITAYLKILSNLFDKISCSLLVYTSSTLLTCNSPNH